MQTLYRNIKSETTTDKQMTGKAKKKNAQRKHYKTKQLQT